MQKRVKSMNATVAGTNNDDSKKKVTGKVLPYSLPSVWPGADPGVHAVNPQVTLSHPPGCRLPLHSARPAFTSAAFTRWRHMIAHI